MAYRWELDGPARLDAAGRPEVTRYLPFELGVVERDEDAGAVRRAATWAKVRG